MNSRHPQHLVRPAKSRHRTAKALLAIVVASGLLIGIPGRSSSATEHSDKDAQLVIDITKGLLQISDTVVQNLSRFLPASETAAVIHVHRHLAQLMAELDTEPATVLAAKQDDHLESILAIWTR